MVAFYVPFAFQMGAEAEGAAIHCTREGLLFCVFVSNVVIQFHLVTIRGSAVGTEMVFGYCKRKRLYKTYTHTQNINDSCLTVSHVHHFPM